MILPSDFPHRFFNPLTSKHREDYLDLLRQRMEDESFDPIFNSVAEAIIINERTIEQEIML